MSRFFTNRAVAIATAMTTVAVAGVDAQTRTRGGQTLEASASIVEAYDGDVPLNVAAITPTSGESRGYSTMFLGDLRHEWQGMKVQFGGTASSALRYFQETGDLRSINHSAGLGLSSVLWPRGSMSVNQTAAYSPSFLFNLFPSVRDDVLGDVSDGAPNYATTNEVTYAYSTTVTVGHGLTPRTGVSVVGQLQHTDFENNENRRDVSAYEFRASLNRNLARNTAMTASYRYRTGDLIYGPQDFEGPTPAAYTTTETGFEVGVVHTRRLSATRRAFVNGAFGSSKLEVPTNDVTGTGPGYRMIGQAAIGYEFARQWQARATVLRGLEYISNLSEPVYLTGFTTDVNGILTDRLNFRGSASYTKGGSAFTTSNAFDTYAGSLRLNLRLMDSMALYGEYLYYYYDFGSGPQLVPGTPAGVERNGARFGFTVRVQPIRGRG